MFGEIFISNYQVAVTEYHILSSLNNKLISLSSRVWEVQDQRAGRSGVH